MYRVRGRLLSVPDDAARKIFFERAFDAVIQIAQMLPSKALEATASTDSNVLLLLRALQSPEILPDLERHEPLALLFLKGLQAHHDLVREADGLMSSEETAELLGVSRQAVDKRRQAGKLIALALGGRGMRYPICQFTARGAVAGLDQLLQILADLDTWMQLTFLISPNAVLNNRKPIDLMKKGELAPVLELAESFGAHAAM